MVISFIITEIPKKEFSTHITVFNFRIQLTQKTRRGGFENLSFFIFEMIDQVTPVGDGSRVVLLQ